MKLIITIFLSIMLTFTSINFVESARDELKEKIEKLERIRQKQERINEIKRDRTGKIGERQIDKIKDNEMPIVAPEPPPGP